MSTPQRNLIRLTLFTLAITLLYSCSEYSKALKEKDQNVKFAKAIEYYNEGECYKALPMFEELIGLTRGSRLAEDVYYYYAKCEYCIKDYYLANYYFKSFTKTFAASSKAEECQFLAAMCSYNLSPEYSLDQTETRAAIDELQLFLDKYPSSSLSDSATHMITGLQRKVERKTFETCKLYVQTEKHKAAVNAFKEFIAEYPDSPYKEESMYHMVRSSFLYAEGSVEEKKLERYRLSSEYYLTFASAFPESKWLKEAEPFFKKGNEQIEKLTSSTVKR